MNQFSPMSSGNAVRLAALTIALLLATGCGERTAKLTAEQGKAFDTAPAEVKQTWEKGLAAEKANDYVAAQTAFDNLKTMYLSDPQSKALDAERAAFGVQLMKAADKNDPTAIQALRNSKTTRKR
jgi:hypothetical protein